MKIKRYTVKDMQEAIKLVKEDLGPEAVIASSYQVPTKGLFGFFLPKLWEVTAVLDEPEDNNNHGLMTNADQLPEKQQKNSGHVLYLNNAGSGGSWPESQSRTEEERQMKARPELGVGAAKLKERFAAVGAKAEDAAGGAGNMQDETQQDNGNAGRFDMIVDKKAESGQWGALALNWRKALLETDENIVDDLLADLRVAPARELAADGEESFYWNLKKRVVHLLEPAYQPTEKARVLTFVGPAGVGKTTTLAKLATILSFNEQKKIAVVAVQAYRLGAIEQLQVYGESLGIPVDVVMTPAELAGVVASHGDKDYILVDTAGRSARNSGQLLELKSFIDAVREPQEVFLTLSLPTKNRDLHKTVKEFQRVKCTKLIFTKLDETDTFGSILNLVVAYGIPVAYLADGQGVPDCISEATPKSIAELLLKGIDVY